VSDLPPQAVDQASVLVRFDRWLFRHPLSLAFSLSAGALQLIGPHVGGLINNETLRESAATFLPAILLAFHTLVVFILVVSLYVWCRPRINPEDTKSRTAVEKLYSRWSWVWVLWLALYSVWTIDVFLQIPQKRLIASNARALAAAYEADPRIPDGALNLIQSALEIVKNNEYPRSAIVARSLPLEKAIESFQDSTESLRKSALPSKVILDTINNVQTLVLVLCFYVLVRSPRPRTEAPPLDPLPLGTALVILLFITQAGISWQYPLSPHLEWFSRISGFAAGVGIALLVGRLESRAIGAPIWTIVALYLYAIIQVDWPDLEGQRLMLAILPGAALMLKTLFFFFMCWLMRSGVLQFYFERTRTEMEYVGPEERRVDRDRLEYVARMLASRTRDSQPNLTRTGN
jgi:hypothetical protein